LRCRKPSSGGTARPAQIWKAEVNMMSSSAARTSEATKTEHGKAHINTRGGRTAIRSNRIGSLSYMYRIKRDPERLAHVPEETGKRITHVDPDTRA
jgi:hypothetical protein